MKKKVTYYSISFFLWIPALFTIVMLCFLAGASFMGHEELSAVTAHHYSFLHIMPSEFTFSNWKTALFLTPEYLLYLWNSVWISLPTLLGSLIISLITGYALAVMDFPGKNFYILVLILVMLLPYQATMTPNFLVLSRMKLIGSRLAVILPGIFQTTGILVMYYFFRTVPTEILDAARIDGAGEWKVFRKIAIPQVSGGIAVITVYNLVEYWGMVEPIIVMLQEETKYPLSVALRSLYDNHFGIYAVCSVLYVIPVFLVFCMLREWLIEKMLLTKEV